MTFSVFISYSTRDLAEATALSTWIASAGAHPYLAEYSLEPGRPMAANILGAIKGCDLFLLLWSQSAKDSEWVPQEIGIAHGAGKAIMPIVLQPGIDLPAFIKDLKYLAVYKDPTTAVQWLQQDVSARVKQKNMMVLAVIGGLLLFLANSK
ncbi:MAG: toll/interleukin-1 receptor domain-containing protein [Vicinamibacterales bacterium]